MSIKIRMLRVQQQMRWLRNQQKSRPEAALSSDSTLTAWSTNRMVEAGAGSS